jgi:hypothetical protein
VVLGSHGTSDQSCAIRLRCASGLTLARRERANALRERLGKLLNGFRNPTAECVDYRCEEPGHRGAGAVFDGSDIMKKAFFSAALAAVLGMVATAALADDGMPPPAAAQHGGAPRGDGPRGHGPMMGPPSPAFAVINDLEQLRRLYALNGHEAEIVAVYHDVLNKTQDPMLRHYVYDSLAREQLKPASPEQAIATLRTSLAEDLAAANKAPHDMPPGQPPARPE